MGEWRVEVTITERETKSVMQRSRSGPHLLVTMGIIGPLECSVDIILVSQAKDT